MGCTFYRVLMREAGSDTWTALGVSAEGRFAQAYGKGVGMRFFDHASAAAAMRAAQNYFEYASRIGTWKVSEVNEP